MVMGEEMLFMPFSASSKIFPVGLTTPTRAGDEYS
jgi:hypothetical protein